MSSYSAHRPGRFGSDGRIEFETDGDQTEDLYLDDVRAQQAAGEPAADERRDADGPEDPFPVTQDLLDDALAMNPTQPVAVTAPVAERQATIGEWGAVDEPGVAEPAADRPVADEEPEAAASVPPVRAKRAKRPRRERTSGWRKLAILGGADGSVLDEVPTETPRFVQMFFVIAGTALISAISMYFALTTGVRIVAWGALPLAIVWMLIIFNLDRFLTSTMRSSQSIGRLIALAIPRVIMAAVIGIVVAEPLVLQIFHNDIAREVNATNITQAQSDQDAVTAGPEKQALDAASERVAALESQAASGVVAGADTTSASAASAQQTVDDLTAKLAAQQQVIDQARAIYQCELTGQGAGEVPGCSGVAGEGASSDAAEAQLAAAQSAYDDLNAQLTAAQADLAAAQAAGTADASASEEVNKQQAKDELPGAREQYQAALAAYDARAAEIASGNSGAVGLLSQISGLERLSAREPTLAWAHWLIAGLFFMIELLPVLVKVLTSYGEPSLYEKADALRRQVALDRVTARSWRERAAIAQGAEA
ncbi:DUF4407 domain-containing protein [Microbacterium ureisolvens]|uniref:DUF4407 domain-containing protein n=1 Tax=Microbacterium ureisolvens TaxID=2781186 RepID=A0ABS7HV07_9MICO|nr:DUF4407 domain-containing protein [Microbacterium ureisolvens]MBW9109191.1 DUF4407 domain-containing protein [Microbacterium ureisolvens]